jgi:hypothetical protein
MILSYPAMAIPLHEFTEAYYRNLDERFVRYAGRDHLLDLLDPDEIPETQKLLV